MSNFRKYYKKPEDKKATHFANFIDERRPDDKYRQYHIYFGSLPASSIKTMRHFTEEKFEMYIKFLGFEEVENDKRN